MSLRSPVIRWHWGCEVVLALSLLLACAVAAAAATNSVIRLEDGWRFMLDAAGHPEQAGFDDKSWGAAHVPHNQAEISNDAPRAPRRVWLRKRFSMPAVGGGQHVVLEVANAEAVEAWVNGHPAGKRGALEFALETDITPHLTPGDNLLVLAVALPGIQGGVRLHVRGPLHVETAGFEVDTPNWQGGPAAVRIRASIENGSAQPRPFAMRVSILGPDGSRLAGVDSGLRTAAAQGATRVELATPPIGNPPLWSVTRPRMSKMVAELVAGGVVIERQQAPFGFRWFRFDPDQGFFLNGAPLKLHAAVYTRIGPQRFPTRRGLWDYEIGLLKGMGLNFLRPTPGVDDTILEECDRAGILTTVRVHDYGKQIGRASCRERVYVLV